MGTPISIIQNKAIFEQFHVFKSNTGRTRNNLNGVVNPDTKEVIIRGNKSINAQSTTYSVINIRN